MFSISSGQFTYSGEVTVIAKFMIKMVLTIPGFKHVVDEEVVKPDLGFWDRASRPVELGHHNGQALADIIVIIIIVIGRKILSPGPSHRLSGRNTPQRSFPPTLDNAPAVEQGWTHRHT